MQITKWIVPLVLSASVVGCGSGNGGSSSGAAGNGAAGNPAASSSKSLPANATAEEVAEEMRGKVRCPARIETQARDPKAPVDDVLGVRPGMTYEEAANVVLCSHDLMVVQPDSRGFQIQTYGATLRQGFTGRIAQPRVEKTSRQIMQEMQDNAISRGGNRVNEDMKPGESKWYVATIGLPGKERVINAAREEWFAEGRNPTVESVEQALLKKYGPPTRNQPSAGGQKYITWSYDPLGRQITETSPLFNRCTGVADPDGGSNFSPDCGEVITATIFSMPDNPGLSRFFQVGVVDQAGGYEAITATEQGLQQLDAARKAQQVQEASKNADSPKL
ncbi:MAG: hypothetical protein WDO56_12545 [Gammaproteobacteria bacterium]